MLERRTFLTGLAALITAPAIVRAGSLMPVRMVVEEPLSGRAIMLMMQQDSYAHQLELRNEIMREYFDANLFGPYMGDVMGTLPVRLPQ